MPVSRRSILTAIGGAIGGGSITWMARGQYDSRADLPPCDCPSAGALWNYQAQLIEVIDGDTVDVLVDLGFRTRKEVRVRVIDIDTAEIHGVSESSDEYQRGMEQKRFVEGFLDVDDDEWPLILRTEGETGQYGRWLGDVNADGRWLSEAVLERWPDAEYQPDE